MFRNCADIKVLDSSSPGPAPIPMPMPTQTPSPSPSPTAATTIAATTSSRTIAMPTGCLATGAENFGGSDAACTLACQLLPSGEWPCGTGHLCDCSPVTMTSTTKMTSSGTTVQGRNSCLPTPGLPPNGATTSNCARCAEGYQWWPCNTKPAICTCTGGSL